jgi:hypothetical protein
MAARLPSWPEPTRIVRSLGLHARSIELRRAGGEALRVAAPAPSHLTATFEFLGFTIEGDR